MSNKVYYVSANFSDCEGHWETFLGIFDSYLKALKVKSEYDKIIEEIRNQEDPTPEDMKNISPSEWSDEVFDEWCKWNNKQSKIYDFNEAVIRVLTINEKQPFELDEES